MCLRYLCHEAVGNRDEAALRLPRAVGGHLRIEKSREFSKNCSHITYIANLRIVKPLMMPALNWYVIVVVLHSKCARV